MESIRIVNFYFYNVFEVDEQSHKKLANLTELFTELYDNYNSDSTNEENANLDHIKTMNYNDEVIRLVEIFKNENDYFQLTFERLHHLIPNVSKVLGESKQLELEEDEYIGHQITVLYDDFHHVFMIQRNISSLSPSAVESFINTLFKDKYKDSNHIEFSLILDNRKQRQIHNAEEYRDMTIRVSRESSKELFKRLISEENRELNIDYFEFKIKAKKNNNEYIARDIAQTLIEQYENNADIEKLTVKAKISDEDNVSLVDVLNQKLLRQVEFTRNDRAELNTNEVFARMRDIYRDDVVHVLPN
ncbi:DUF6731 family protein [Staphylococcus simulans]|uniref:DUF6731 family protein n=3 Tax=Staphylococcus simulans TaxID=1286 RepID=UPI000D02B9A3|nr:DUF6731 family protein [Staphylococcus simulans]PTJ26716.1 hypothetical protein BU030_01520 [Staphylococcus simulans]PTJ49884.1 hypothetical protein BU019_11920 [Staphylococcus simulans]RIN42669.1 hypothetical protein BU043_04315 [Staphylococcus simulans]RIN70740.1 hypothetical protein BU031_03380 [Staphylococcus simulans]